MKTSKYIFIVLFIFVIFMSGVPQIAVSQAPSYYEGDGGSSISLVILRPTGSSLDANDAFVLDYMQTILLGNFKKYTAINTTSQITAAEVVKKDTVFLLISKLSRMGSNYILDISVTNSVTGRVRTTHMNSNARSADIMSAQAFIDAFIDISQKLGVKFTEAGLASARKPPMSEIQGAISLARGNLAEKNSNPIEMLTHLYNASQYNPSLLDAGNRFNELSNMLASGDVGESIKTDFENREKWREILDEFDAFYAKHPPFILSFDPVARQKGDSDYDKQTAVFEFSMNFQEDMSFEAMKKVFVSVATGLKNTGNQEKWGFVTRPYRSPLFNKFRTYTVKAQLVNNKDKVLADTTFTVRSRIVHFRNKLHADTTQKTKVSFKSVHNDDITGNMIVRVVSIDGIETQTASRNGFVRIVPVDELPKKKARGAPVTMTRNRKSY